MTCKSSFTTAHILSSRHRWVQSADTHLLEWQCVCEPPGRLRLCVYDWSGLQRRLPTGGRNQTQWRGLETQLWPLCYMLLQGTEDEHTHTNSLHMVILVFTTWWRNFTLGIHCSYDLKLYLPWLPVAKLLIYIDGQGCMLVYTINKYGVCIQQCLFD